MFVLKDGLGMEGYSHCMKAGMVCADETNGYTHVTAATKAVVCRSGALSWDELLIMLIPCFSNDVHLIVKVMQSSRQLSRM